MKFHLALLFSCLLTQLSASEYLFKDGKSDYSIVLPANASASELTAATELSTYIEQMSGVRLPITKVVTGKCVFIGWNNKTNDNRPDDTEEGYIYKTIKKNLFIYGGRNNGTMHGVYAFLEQEMGVHWLTSSCTYVPKRRAFAIDHIYRKERPAFAYRSDFFHDALQNIRWNAHNRLNSHPNRTNLHYGPQSAYWGIHTFAQLIQPERYFKPHPEYFSLLHGKRSDKAQLCLSNAGMRSELIKNLKNVIRENPGYWCYDVSQNDNTNPCECRNCQRLVKRLGGQSGIMLWFVNQVAREIRKDYPHVKIGTFAYQYTRHAPTSVIKPDDNVVVRLCSIECCMAHALEACKQNNSFVYDLEMWQKKTRNIYIWDYATGFDHYLLPFPNFAAMAANLRYFAKTHVTGIMEEGAYNARWNEFSELKQWMIAKLMWNPWQSADSLANVFIRYYYEEAAPHIERYYHLCQRQVGADTHFDIHVGFDSKIYDDTFISQGLTLMDKATAAVSKKPAVLQRVNRMKAQVDYLKLRRSPIKSAIDGTSCAWKSTMQADKTIITETGLTYDTLLKDINTYLHLPRK